MTTNPKEGKQFKVRGTIQNATYGRANYMFVPRGQTMGLHMVLDTTGSRNRNLRGNALSLSFMDAVDKAAIPKILDTFGVDSVHQLEGKPVTVHLRQLPHTIPEAVGISPPRTRKARA